MGNGRHSLLLLGPPALRCGENEIARVLPKKAFVLLAILWLSPGHRASRSVLAGWMYEDADQAGALQNLRQLLTRINARQAQLGTRLIATSRNEVRLVAARDDVCCDLDVFQGLSDPQDGTSLRHVAELYRGDLLEGVAGCGESLDAWIAMQRERLRNRCCELFLSGARLVGGAEGETALGHLLGIEPYREDAWRALIRLRADRHGLGSAETTYERMRRRFRSELKSEPDAETVELVAVLRRTVAANVGQQPGVRGTEAERDTGTSCAEGFSVAPRLCLLMPDGAWAEPAHAGLAEALVEDVTFGLCRLRSIAVIAPHSAMQVSARTSSDLFGARYVGETSIRSFAGRTRLAVRLIRTSDRLTLWGDEYDLLAGQPEQHHRELTRSIVDALASGVERAELSRFEAAPRPDAYHLYLLGRQHLRALGLPEVRRARKAFAQAADRAPAFVPALNGICRTLILEWLLLARPDQVLLRQALSIASRAIEMDPFSGEALRELASATLFLGDFGEAADGFARAERLAPHHADILAEHANALAHCSEMMPALRRIEQAIELNPLPPDDYLWTAGGALFFLEDYEGALSQLGRMKRPEPAFRLKAACLAKAGRRDEAAVFATMALEDQPNFRIDEWIATIPLRSKRHVAHYASALSEAGFR